MSQQRQIDREENKNIMRERERERERESLIIIKTFKERKRERERDIYKKGEWAFWAPYSYCGIFRYQYK